MTSQTNSPPVPKSEPIGVADWTEAYAVCRERDRPLRVMDRDGSVTLIFPSGADKPCRGGGCDLFILPEEEGGVA